MAFDGGEMSEGLLPASEVALDANTRRAIESAYRRGYVQGYSAAAYDMNSFEHIQFAAIDLMEWRLSDKGRLVSPPSFGEKA